MHVFYSEEHRKHDPPFEVLDGGLRGPYLEAPARLDRILDVLRAVPGLEFAEPPDFGLGPIRAVHSPDYLEFLASAWDAWIAAYPENLQVAGGAALLPATFALRRQSHRPASILGRAGYHMMDLSAVIVSGTYSAAVASAHCALAAAAAILDDNSSGPASLALCRPPGHHAGRDYAAGYCFINNAAVAAQHLSGVGPVAILDVDYHAGNGTQDIFYDRSDVLSISLHADPASEYPYYAGYADETGSGAGSGFHHNFPLPPATGDEEYLSTLDQALELIRDFSPRFLVVSAGMDVYQGDPLGRFNLTSHGIRSIGERVASLLLPTAVILEGGYNNAELGHNMSAFLSPFSRV